MITKRLVTHPLIAFSIESVFVLNLTSCVSVAFQMYDLDSDDKISREELLAVLHMMVGDNISEEQVGGHTTSSVDLSE